MSSKRLPNSNPQVKRKVGLPVAKRLRRMIPDGATFTTTTLNKMSKRTRAGKKSPGYLLKREFKEWLRDYPGMSAAFWNVACVLVDLYNFRYGKAWPSTETVREMSGAKSIRTVDNAIKFFHEQGLIFVKSGGYGSIRSNNYVPNLRLILNDDTGEIIHNCTYMGKTENWAVVSAVNPRGCHVPVRKKCGAKSGPQKMRSEKSNNRHNGANPVRKICGLRSDSVVEGAKNAAPPPSAGAAGSGSAPRLTEESGPMPWETETGSLKVRYILAGPLASKLKFSIRNLIEGKGDQVFLDLCKAEIYSDKIRELLFDQQRPTNGTPYGHIRVDDGTGILAYVEGGPLRIKLDKLKDTDTLVIEYVPSRTTLLFSR